MDNMEKIIEATRSSFEKSFSEQAFYNRQTQDRNHLNSIIEVLNLRPGLKILDLGTGSGYIAFGIAGSHPDISITGLDIVTETLNENRKRADEIGMKNLDFVSYDGMHFPFDDEIFDVIVTRYALHHFPDINGTFKEIYRVLKTDGKVFVADPAPNDNDTEGFVDEYMQMKKDGHIKFYSEDEFRQIGAAAGLHMLSNNMESIRFPKKRKDAAEFENIVARHSKTIVDGYSLEVTEDEIYITEQVNNILFDKSECNMKAVIFDMDGLMLDTERLCVESYDYAGEQIGIGKAGYMVYRTLGMNERVTKEYFEKEYGSASVYDKILPYSKQYFYDYYDRNGVPVKKGLNNILQCAKNKGYKIAVASSSSESVVKKNLKLAGVIEYFDQIIAGDMIHRSKPDPDIYLKACEVLGETPADCYALEDSRNGLWSAYNAGCKPVMIPDLWQSDSVTDAIIYARYTDLDEACELFK